MTALYENYFTRGFFVTNIEKDSDIEVLEGWEKNVLGKVVFKTQQKTMINKSKRGVGRDEVFHVFIGYPADIYNHELSPSEISQKSLDIYLEDGFESYEKYVAYLGGRFLSFLVKSQGDMVVHPDCHATYACYLFRDKEKVALSSHVNILQKTFDLEVNEDAVAIIKSDNYKSPGGKYYPGLMTPYKGVLPLLPNCRLDISCNKSEVKHNRFYPFVREGKVEENVKESGDFQRYFDMNLKAIVKDKNFYISLTSGMDSRVTLLSAIKNGLSEKCKTFTYFRGKKSSDDQIEDLVVASKISFSEGIPHKALLIKDIDFKSSFHKMYAYSFQRCARFPSLARAYYEELPHDILSLVSTCSETGMAFYKKRDDYEITPELLSRLFTPSSVNKEDVVIECFSKYIKYSDFEEGRLGWLDLYDAFYWEHRNAKWASLWYSEADLSHFTVIPYNQRDIIESMLAAPLPDRKSKKLIKEYS